ncbi:MAG: 1,4-alpha-glucan branching protein GlgB [Firmicutes bacterium]|nr:1,4-alpha-glucan branching protein GlgB [Bacillota bacterium]
MKKNIRLKYPNEYDRYLFCEGNHFESYKFMGAQIKEIDGVLGVRFVVWAPRAAEVHLIGDFNGWDEYAHPMEFIKESGLWCTFVAGLREGTMYKYLITAQDGKKQAKADPYGFFAELRPKTASVVWNLEKYEWNDSEYLKKRKKRSVYNEPMVIYEVHLASWKQRAIEDFYSYAELADDLIPYVKAMGYTHIELLPLAEHPFDGSWGYQATGYFSATSRYGFPEDLMYFIDKAHSYDIGIIMDWVPGHFCKDDHGLRLFDGTPTFEYNEPWRSENLGWGTSNFDLGRNEVRSFLISNAVFWFDVYHIDGIRVDAVANMLYLDYGRQPGSWTPNIYGGRENLEAIAFLRRLNEAVFEKFKGVLMVAEESSAWPMVTKPTYLGGLGFNYKWNMGWMNDMLTYMELDPVFKKYHHNLVTFSLVYAFSENFILPLSHDEVVHGKKSLLDKMPGDYWQKFANLRAFYGFMMAHPGKKLLFMGGEFGQFIEWRYYEALDWHLLGYPIHDALRSYVRDLNHFYLNEKALWQEDHHWHGFDWIECNDNTQSTVSFIRYATNKQDFVIIVSNFTPIVRYNYSIGVPEYGEYVEVFNSDNEIYNGSGQTNTVLYAEDLPWQNQPYSITLKIPPLATLYLKLKTKRTPKMHKSIPDMK